MASALRVEVRLYEEGEQYSFHEQNLDNLEAEEVSERIDDFLGLLNFDDDERVGKNRS